MVGVPGRSKGCGTCKRRKLGVGFLTFRHYLVSLGPCLLIFQCDLQRPTCGQCARSHRTCDGYAQYPVFINFGATASEQQQQQPAENQSKARRHRKSHWRAVQPPTPSLTAPPVHAQHQDDTGREEQALQPFESPKQYSRLPPQVGLSAIYNKKIQDLYLEIYLPSEQSARAAPLDDWLAQAVYSSNPSTALEFSLLAFCKSRVGRFHNDQNLIVQGQVAYCAALRELQRALWDRKLMYRDETLAAAFTLSQYEVRISIGHPL